MCDVCMCVCQLLSQELVISIAATQYVATSANSNNNTSAEHFFFRTFQWIIYSLLVSNLRHEHNWIKQKLFMRRTVIFSLLCFGFNDRFVQANRYHVQAVKPALFQYNFYQDLPNAIRPQCIGRLPHEWRERIRSERFHPRPWIKSNSKRHFQLTQKMFKFSPILDILSSAVGWLCRQVLFGQLSCVPHVTGNCLDSVRPILGYDAQPHMWTQIERLKLHEGNSCLAVTEILRVRRGTINEFGDNVSLYI